MSLGCGVQASLGMRYVCQPNGSRSLDNPLLSPVVSSQYVTRGKAFYTFS